MIDYTNITSVLEFIKNTRQQQGMSITMLSKKLGFKTASGYANIEYGKRNLSFINAVRIFQILNIRFNDVDIDSFTLSNLRKYREARGITITFISKKLGYKRPSSYANIEHGIRNLSFVNAVKVSEVLNVELEELFF